MLRRTRLIPGRFGILAAVATLALAAGVPVAGASEFAYFTGLSDNTLTPDVVTTQAAVPLQMGVPEVFHSFGSQAAEFPAGFVTVPGPFSGPGAFDVVLIAATAHQFAPQFARFTVQIKNGTTGQ